MIIVAPPSLMSVLIRSVRERVDGLGFGTITQGSGFFVASVGITNQTLLITNWHVLTGRDPQTDEPLAAASRPTHVEIEYFVTTPAGSVVRMKQSAPLYDPSGDALWLVHPEWGRIVDVAALPIDVSGVTGPGGPASPGLYATDEPQWPAVFEPTSDASIVGYPDVVVGRTNTAVWTRASIASEPDLDFDDKPLFLVDARGRPGQSGSPVIGYWKASDTKATRGGGLAVGTGTSWELLGVYSGRITETSDLGRVWKRAAVREVVHACLREQYRDD